MVFSLTDEQQMLRASAERFVEQEYSFEDRQRVAGSESGFSKAHWSTFAEMGWLALPFSEEDDGLGGTASDLMVLMREFGRGLIVEPYLSTVVLAGRAIALTGNTEQRRRWLPGIGSGEVIASLAYAEPRSRYDLAAVGTRAARTGDGWRLDGHKAMVLGGPSAELLVVAARTGGAERDRRGVSLFLVPASAAGLIRTDYTTIDGMRASELALSGVRVDDDALLGEADCALDALEAVVDGAIAAVSAEAAGTMTTLVELTADYLRSREQFGLPLAKFQALQHRMADMYLEKERGESVAVMAAGKMDADETERALAASAAKVVIGRAGRYVGQQAVQLHGGIGTTEELSVGHYFKRLTAIGSLFGDVDYHLERFAALSHYPKESAG